MISLRENGLAALIGGRESLLGFSFFFKMEFAADTCPIMRTNERMIYMCKVYEFPVKKEIPKELEDRLNEVTKLYVNVMTEILDTLCDGEPTEEDYNEFMEMMIVAYVKSLEKALDELE